MFTHFIHYQQSTTMRWVFDFPPLFIVLSIFAITMCRQLIMKIIFFIINGPRTVFNTHLCHDSFINSLKKQKEERLLNHNWTAISDASFSLIPHFTRSLSLSSSLFAIFIYIFNVVWMKMKLIWRARISLHFRFISCCCFT